MVSEDFHIDSQLTVIGIAIGHYTKILASYYDFATIRIIRYYTSDFAIKRETIYTWSVVLAFHDHRLAFIIVEKMI